MTRSIHFSGQLTPKEYMGALYLHNSPQKYISPLLIGLAAFYCGGVILSGSFKFSDATFTVLLFPFFILLIWKLFIYPRQLQNLWFQEPILQKTYDFVLMDDGLEVTEAQGKFFVKWSELHRAQSQNDLTLLYLSLDSFVILPHRWFPAEEDFSFFLDCLSLISHP